MKNFLKNFLVASLMITAAVSISSCKKTETNGSWVPTTYDLIDTKGVQHSSKDIPFADCVYCDDPVYMCDHGIDYLHNDTICLEHNHIHWFEANDDCMPQGQATPYYCVYNGVRKHRHIIIYFPPGYHNDWHIGGMGYSE